ncbi:MAG TPA: iron-sulfur cluster assembly accessory protein [Thermoanaerobaculales bacterium]|nr:iron-sulfur cluster assembly accessory protein [Thermoanaerobaculales bacterium]HQL30148.1 iron-sulfur cluster assembly accessory protein [Thermoanaerobaculales bacterium]
MTAVSGRLIVVTERAQREIREIFERERPGDGAALRLGVIGGGCSGLSYEMRFDEPRATDQVLELDGFAVVLDPKSSIYLKGVTLDYQDGLEGKGFVFSNPNASNTCGCGESFNV